MSENAQRDLLERYAELVVRIGANVQPGQDVSVDAMVEHVPVARAVADAAYRAGARRVLVDYIDLVVRRSAVAHAPFEALGTTYPFEIERVRWMRAHGVALIQLTGTADEHLFDGLDPDRLAAARSRDLHRELMKAIMSGEVAWTVAAAPNEGWASQVFGEPDVARLWQAVAIATRLDGPDPVAGWREHLARLHARAAALTGRGLDGVRFHGPGTDLTVGLIPAALWLAGSERTTQGIEFVPNLPTEEVFTTPDWRRAEGHVACTAPLVLPNSGAVVEGLRLWMEGGRIVRVEADRGADLVRAQIARDTRSVHLGEVSIVDETSAVRRAGIVFHDTVFDENAGCHIAWGHGFNGVIRGAETWSDEQLIAAGVNAATDHTDVIVGGPGVDVTGLTADGSAVPIVVDNRWVLPVE